MSAPFAFPRALQPATNAQAVAGIDTQAYMTSAQTLRAVQARAPIRIKPQAYGCACNGVTDDSANFQLALNAAASVGGFVDIGGLIIYFASSVTIPPNAGIVGCFAGLNIAVSPATAYGSNLILASTATINVTSAACIDGVLITRSGLIISPSASQVLAVVAAYAGNAITQLGGQDITIKNTMILGFNYAIYGADNTSTSRLWCSELKIDCNNGIKVIQSQDVSYLFRVHCWNFVTWGTVSPPAGNSYRPGKAFQIGTYSDFTICTDCFSWNYEVGFSIEGSQNVRLKGCAADGANYSGTSTGYQLINGSDSRNSGYAKFEGCTSSGQAYAFVSNVPNNLTSFSEFVGCSSWGITAAHYHMVAGNYLIDKAFIWRNGSTSEVGVVVENSAGANFAQISEPFFSNLPSASWWTFAGGTQALTTVYGVGSAGAGTPPALSFQRPLPSSAVISLGYNCSAVYQGDLAIGRSCTANGGANVALGDTNTANGTRSAVLGGYGAITKNRYGCQAWASANFGASLGTGQMSLMLLYGTTTGAASQQLSSNNFNLTNAQIPAPINNFSCDMEVRVTGVNTATGDAATWIFPLVIVKRTSSAANTTVAALSLASNGTLSSASGAIATPTLSIGSGLPSCSVTLSADTTNGGLNVTGTGATGLTIRWLAKVTFLEIGTT